MSVFSGHDYTLLGLFGLLGACENVKSSIGFSSFALFELYDGLPPDSTLSGTSNSGEMYVRIKCNFNPFFDKDSRIVTETTMQDSNMVTLKDYKVSDLKTSLEEVRDARDEKNLLHTAGTPICRLKSQNQGETFYLSKHTDADASFCNSSGNSPMQNNDFSDIPRVDCPADLITNPCSEDND